MDAKLDEMALLKLLRQRDETAFTQLVEQYPSSPRPGLRPPGAGRLSATGVLMEDEMTCRQLVELVTEYLEGTLPDEACKRMENHVSGCDGCTHYLEQMRQTIRLTGKVREETLTPRQRDDLLRLFRDWQKG